MRPAPCSDCEDRQMVENHQNHDILDERLHAESMQADLLVEPVFVVHHGTQQIRPDEHDEDAGGGMDAEGVTESVHDYSRSGTEEHIHAAWQGDGHHEEAYHIDIRMAYSEELQMVEKQHLLSV